MSTGPIKVIATNRKARFNYEIEQTLEVGIVLKGSEVKVLRSGQLEIKESFVQFTDNEAWLLDSHIPIYPQAGPANHATGRARKLLMKKREIEKWSRHSENKGYSIVPLKVYFHGSLIKVEIGLGKGRKNYDKRHHLKEKSAKMDMRRALNRRD